MNFQNSLKTFSNKSLIKSRKSVKRLAKRSVGVLTNYLPGKIQYKVKQLPVYSRLVPSPRPQRVYLTNGLSHIKFLEILNERKVEYVLLRWWEDLPMYPEGEDINILVRDEHRELINDLVTGVDKNGIKCDLYTVTGAKNGSRMNIPVFSQNLTRDLMNTRTFYNGAYVPSEIPFFASVAYHAIFHKGHNSGIPGFNVEPTKYVYDYTEFLKSLAYNLKIKVDISVKGLYQWLKGKGYAPAADTLAKLAEIRPEIAFLETPLSSDVRGGEVIAFVIREKLHQDGLLGNFKKSLEEEFQFDVLDVKIFTEKEKEICTTQIRGGKWDNGPWRESGGPPVALVVAFDYHPIPFDSLEQKQQPRTTNKNTVNAKYGFRTRLNNLDKVNNYNGLHSADNEPDAWFYISLMGNEYRQEILNMVELRRERYAVKWGIVKRLTQGPISKVELIKYKNRIAVKKTFRPGKEEFLEREIYCTKILSKELPSIPILLEEGDGFIVIQYIQNLLDGMNFREKKNRISNKSQEILKIISEMYSRNLAITKVTLDSTNVSSEDELFRTGYSYVNTYKILLESPQEVIAISSLPQNTEGDKPLKSGLFLSSFSNVWNQFLTK